jgi:methionyl-tRNA synthetase
MIVRTGLNLAALFARLSQPFTPFAAKAIADALGETALTLWPSGEVQAELSRLEAGRKISAPDVLFRKIDDAQVAEWAERFGGAESA